MEFAYYIKVPLWLWTWLQLFFRPYLRQTRQIPGDIWSQRCDWCIFPIKHLWRCVMLSQKVSISSFPKRLETLSLSAEPTTTLKSHVPTLTGRCKHTLPCVASKWAVQLLSSALVPLSGITGIQAQLPKLPLHHRLCAVRAALGSGTSESCWAHVRSALGKDGGNKKA